MPTEQQEVTKTPEENKPVEVEVRRAREEELVPLGYMFERERQRGRDLILAGARLRAAQTEEQRQKILEQIPPTFVSLHGQILSGGIVARPTWEVEMVLARGLKQNAPPAAIRRIVFRLSKTMADWIGDREQNASGAHSFHANIVDSLFQQLAQEFGMTEIYSKGRVFGMRK